MSNYRNKFIFHNVDHVRAHVPAYDAIKEVFGVGQADRFAQELVDKTYPVRPFVSLLASFSWPDAASTLNCGLDHNDFNQAHRDYPGVVTGYTSTSDVKYREAIDHLRGLGIASEVDYETGKVIQHASAPEPATEAESPSPLSKDFQVGGAHYSKLTIQPWDVMRETLSHEAFCGFLHGNVIKYVMRDKNGIEDFKKAQHYLSVLIAEIEGDYDGQA